MVDIAGGTSTTSMADKPLYTNDQIATFLTTGYWAPNGATSAIRFDVGADKTISVNIANLNTEGQFFARAALSVWKDATGIAFVEVNTSAQISFDDAVAGGAYAGMSWGGDGFISSAEINIGTAWIANDGTNLNSYSYQTYLHEIGHALGLGHGGFYNGSATYGVDNQYRNDSWQASVMSYFSQSDNTSMNNSFALIMTPMMADLLAVQSTYGASTNTRTGDTVYGFNSNAGNAIFDASRFNNVSYVVFDNGGKDTLDYSGFSQAQNISLVAETFSNVGGLIGNIGIARGALIENARGGSGADTITGNSAANLLYGNGGADILNGGLGKDFLYGGLGADVHIGGNGAGEIDMARYDDANYGDLVIRMDNSALSTGAAFGDTYIGIEAIVGGLGNDTIYGDAGANRLFGMAGNDKLYGGAGNDYLKGLAGKDFLYGGLGADVHIGGDGAGEVDMARYDDANYGDLVIRMDNSALSTGAAFGDTYFEIEAIVGGVGNDTIIGDTGANRLFGMTGNDRLYGGLGDDYLKGGAGADVFFFTTALGAANIDTLPDFLHLTDDIALSRTIFASIGAALSSDELCFGTFALDTNDYLIYNQTTGQLFYDFNANTSGGQTQFALVAVNTVLTFDDFMMV